jgi:hypothetical protein
VPLYACRHARVRADVINSLGALLLRRCAFDEVEPLLRNTTRSLHDARCLHRSVDLQTLGAATKPGLAVHSARPAGGGAADTGRRLPGARRSSACSSLEHGKRCRTDSLTTMT